MNLKKVMVSSLSVAALSLTAAANADVIDIDVTDIASWDAQGSGNNVVLEIDLGMDSVVTAIAWDVTITPNGDSWYSEATAGFGTTLENLINLRPGAGDDFGGDGIAQAYSSDFVVFADVGLADIVLTDGILVIEFFEGFDDITDSIDAVWGGTISVEFTPVPLPGAVLFLMSGLGALGVFGRKRA